ncbi:MAG: InlB B-repeat-containing protein, partial [Clostridia bacterium]|nr:InlB B-repeat-containing protein [Clostridia bacterium]
DTYTGTTGETAEAEYTVATGFVLNEEKSILSGVIAADGSLVLKVCFDRLKSVISINGADVECCFGEEIAEPEKPEPPEGYVQSGWVDENGNAIEFPLVLTVDFPKEIKAFFVKQSYLVSWNVDGSITEETYAYQSEIAKPDDPIKEGYIFKGWSPEIPDSMPAYDMEFVAVFERIVYSCTECDFETYDETEYNEHMAYEQSKKDVRISINNNPGTANIKYGETLKLTASTTIDVEGTKIFWYVDGVRKGEGKTFSITFEKGTKTVEAKIVDDNGTVLKDADGHEISDSQKVTVNSSFWQKIVSLFKNLFGINRIITQALFR